MIKKKFQAISNKFLKGILAASLALSLTACASTSYQNDGVMQEIGDPLEPLNRTIFGINEFLDIFIIGPFAAVYDAVLPDFAKDSVRSFLRNLETPVVFANQLLQGDLEGAGDVLGRFGLNSTIGLAGLIDVAEEFNLPYENEDFGQTLATWGANDGFYLVLPLFGPSSFRDAIGLAVDSFADPLNMYARNTDRLWIPVTRSATRGIDTRSRLTDVVNDVRKNSLDPYATYRNMYFQSRQIDIHDGQVKQPEIPE